MRKLAALLPMIAMTAGTACGSSESDDREFTCTPSDETVPNAACPDEARFCWSDGYCHANPGSGSDSGTPPPPPPPPPPSDSGTPPPPETDSGMPPAPLPPGAEGRCDLATCDLRTQTGAGCCPEGQRCYSRYDVAEGVCSRIVGAWTAGRACSGPDAEGFGGTVCAVGAECTANPNGEERPPAARQPFCRTVCESDADCAGGRCMQTVAERDMRPFPFGVCSIPCSMGCLFACVPITVTLFGTTTRVEVEQCASLL